VAAEDKASFDRKVTPWWKRLSRLERASQQAHEPRLAMDSKTLKHCQARRARLPFAAAGAHRQLPARWEEEAERGVAGADRTRGRVGATAA